MNLTINEQLMNDIKDANLCLFISNLATWLKTNSAKLHKPLEERNFHEGRYWSYNSIQGFVKFFGFWSTQNIKTIIKKGIAEGLIVTNTFNRKKFDNTLWYSLTDKALEYYPSLRDTTLNTLVRSNQPLVRSNHTIPEHTTTSSNNTITTTSSSKVAKTNELLRELIEIYRQVFPNNPQPHTRLISPRLEKTLKILIKRWPEADPNKNPISHESFRSYLEVLKQNAPQFALGEYVTSSGKHKKNDMEVFCRWNTLINVLENKYS
jgi:hypothetical protein